jgi:bacterioferritin (cytochrome b1)
MSAKIIRTELFKSINQTMTVVVVERTDAYTGATDKSARVLFLDSFGNVKSKREFRSIQTMEEFVANQLCMEHDWRCAFPTA